MLHDFCYYTKKLRIKYLSESRSKPVLDILLVNLMYNTQKDCFNYLISNNSLCCMIFVITQKNCASNIFQKVVVNQCFNILPVLRNMV